jgi:hypothetical protein
MQHVLRAVRTLAFLYDFVWALAFVVGGAAIAIVGLARSEATVVAIGGVLTAFGAIWIAYDVWPSRSG